MGKHRAAEHRRVDNRVVSGAVVAGIDGDDLLPTTCLWIRLKDDYNS